MNLNPLLTTVQSAISPYQRILVAFSGGVDSTVLLHLLLQIQRHHLPELKLRAIYIHHGLSDNADDWAKHCQHQCQQWQIPIEIIKVKLNPQAGNIEAQAREARYQELSQKLQIDEALVTAQHLDDQCETFFLALKRGSGPAGLSAMAARCQFANGVLIRPLITVTRQQIEQYALTTGLNWVEDESNQSREFDRNFLRLDILPTLVKRWPHFLTMVSRSAELCAQQEQLIDELLVESMLVAIDQQKRLDIDYLSQQTEGKRNAILRRWFDLHQRLMPSRQQLTRLWSEVALARPDAEPQLIIDNRQVRRFQKKLYLLPIFTDISQHILRWDMDNVLLLPDKLGYLQSGQGEIVVRKPQANEVVTIRFTARGEFKIVGRNHSRSIKKIWQELNIAPWLRQRIPLLYYNDQLIAAIGVFVTQQGQATADSIALSLDQ